MLGIVCSTLPAHTLRGSAACTAGTARTKQYPCPKYGPHRPRRTATRTLAVYAAPAPTRPPSGRTVTPSVRATTYPGEDEPPPKRRCSLRPTYATIAQLDEVTELLHSELAALRSATLAYAKALNNHRTHAKAFRTNLRNRLNDCEDDLSDVSTYVHQIHTTLRADLNRLGTQVQEQAAYGRSTYSALLSLAADVHPTPAAFAAAPAFEPPKDPRPLPALRPIRVPRPAAEPEPSLRGPPYSPTTGCTPRDHPLPSSPFVYVPTASSPEYEPTDPEFASPTFTPTPLPAVFDYRRVPLSPPGHCSPPPSPFRRSRSPSPDSEAADVDILN